MINKKKYYFGKSFKKFLTLMESNPHLLLCVILCRFSSHTNHTEALCLTLPLGISKRVIYINPR